MRNRNAPQTHPLRFAAALAPAPVGAKDLGLSRPLRGSRVDEEFELRTRAHGDGIALVLVRFFHKQAPAESSV